MKLTKWDTSLRQNSITRPTVLKYAIRLPELYYSDLHSCFHRVQNDLEKGFLGLFGTTGIPDINLKSFHYYQSLQDSLTEVMKVLLPIILIFSIFYAANNIIKVSTSRIAKRYFTDNCYRFRH